MNRRPSAPWSLLALLLAVFAAAVSSARADDAADTLAAVRAKGELVAGVKADYEPFGYRDAAGAIVGFDVDVATGLAAAAGVPVRLVPVTSANRMQKLAAGEVDVLVATLGDTVDRRRLVRMIEPGYYGGGASVLVPGDSAIRSWADVRGRPLCAVQGALWNRLAAARLLADIRAFGTVRDAELALREGGCAGWLYDEAALKHQLATGGWPGYRLLPAEFVSPWAVAVAGEGTLARLFDDTVAGWLRDGRLAELEARWKLPPSDYLREAGALWTRRDADGEWHCRRQPDGLWPATCRELDLIEAQDLRGLGGLILTLRDRVGVDFTPFYDPFSREMFLRALATTLALAVAVVAGSLVAGAAGAALLRSRIRAVAAVSSVLLTLPRMTPPLLQLYLVFFGIGGLLAARGLPLPAWLVSVVVLSLYAGAANAVALAEAAATLGGRGRFRQVAALAFPTVMGSCVNIVKATAMVSAVAVPELVHASTAIIADYGNGGVMMNVLLACYVAIVLAVVHGFTLLERGMARR